MLLKRCQRLPNLFCEPIHAEETVCKTSFRRERERDIPRPGKDRPCMLLFSRLSEIR